MAEHRQLLRECPGCKTEKLFDLRHNTCSKECALEVRAVKTEESNQPSKFIALFDIHCGWERKRVKNITTTVPTHNAPAITAALAFARDLQPDIIVLGGDQLNFAPVSHWNKTNFWSNEGGRIKKEMDILDYLVLSPIEQSFPNARKVWMDGNHEVWLEQFLEQNPAIEGLVEPVNYLRLEQRGWEMYGQGEMLPLGKLNVIHGDKIKGANPAQKAGQKYGCNVRSGHHHTAAWYTMYNPVDSKDIKTSISVPCLAMVNPVYGKNEPNTHLNGFLFGYIWPNGNYSDYVVVMADNTFVSPDGKRYCGKELMREAA